MISAGSSLGVLGTLVVTLLAWGVYLSFLLWIDWTRYVIDAPGMRELALRVHLPGGGRQPHQHAGRSTAPAIRARPRPWRTSLPKPTATCSRPKRPCAGPTGWPRWANSRRAWRTSCAIRWAPFAPRPRCSTAASPRKTKWRAKWPVSLPRKWTAPIRWSRAFWISCARSNCGRPRPTWRKCSTARSPWRSGKPPRARLPFTRTTRRTFRRSRWTPS